MEEFIRNYGYIAVFLFSCIEGEMAVLFSGAMAYLGYMDVKYVILCAFLGTLLADQLCFHIGHYYGRSFLKKFPSLELKAQKVFYYLHKYKALFIFTFRFIYGIRIASPLIIGAGGIPIRYFTLLNVPAAAIWAIISVGLGYIFADAINSLVSNLHVYQKNLAIGALAIIGFYMLMRKIIKK
jgi:membrane protein DedA with SNARE-associated domain